MSALLQKIDGLSTVVMPVADSRQLLYGLHGNETFEKANGSVSPSTIGRNPVNRCPYRFAALCKVYAVGGFDDNNFRQGRAFHSTFHVTRVAIGQDRSACARLW